MGGIQDLAQGRKDLYLLDPDVLVEDPGWNVRNPGPELDAYVRWLADSIKENGVREPLTVWMNGQVPTVTNGHCRLLAVKLAKKEGAEIRLVPVRVEERNASEGDRILSMITRNSGKPLTQLETAEVICRLERWGWTREEIAKKTGYSLSQVGNFLSMAALPPALTKPIQEGKVSASLVNAEVRARGPKEAEKVIEMAVEDAEEKGKRKVTKKDLPERPRKPKDRPLPLNKKEVDWKKWGPLFLEALQDICKTGIVNAGPAIATARELLDSYRENK